MPNLHNRQLFNNRRKELRKNSTYEENLLWHNLRRNKLGYKFYRQHSIGQYILDFYCAAKRIVIEIDGQQHLENKEYDKERTLYLESLGYKVLRFWNGEINTNLKHVLEKIRSVLETTPQSPPFQGGEARKTFFKKIGK